jgi:hypothetical protein
VAGKTTPSTGEPAYDPDDETIVRDRLSGLGYIG